MADSKTSSIFGTTVLGFATLFNFVALISLSVYQIHYQKTVADRHAISSAQVLQHLANELSLGSDVTSRRRRDVGDLQDRDLARAIRDLAQVQRDLSKQPCRSDCRGDVIKVLQDIYSDRSNNDVVKRQTQPGGELAQIFSEIAKSEVDILHKYCTNGSAVCLPGEKGAPGQVGTQGLRGTDGLPGVKGDTGNTGLSGTTGVKGDPGIRGTDGIQGLKGASGLIGAHGLQGPQGTAGQSGVDGLLGSKGEKGDTGQRGVDGSSGQAGIAGQKGDPGSQGLQGTNGTSGQPGAPGLPGTDGANGKPGLQGLQGADGTNGQLGAPGLPGVDGTKGEPGLQGVRGADGVMGQPGVQGLQGLAGIKGDTGVPGTQGLRGVKGDDGSSGLSGPPGLKGDPGARGLQGPPGFKGEKGDRSRDAGTLLAVPTKSTTSCCTSLATPGFPQPSQQITVIEGTTINLKCNGTGYPPPKISWNPPVSTLDRSRFLQGTNVVTVVNTKTTDTAIYSCISQNALGTAEKQFVVNVLQHIRFEELPKNYTVMMGNNVVLECKVEGPLHPIIKWFKVMPDGSRLQLTNGITLITNGSQLAVNGVSEVSAGEYICEGDNGVEKKDMIAYITTFGPPHIRDPGTITAIKGQKVRLKCEADAHPPATITWTYPPGVTNAYKDTDGSLVVLNVQAKDATSFFCHAANKYGTDDGILKLEVKTPPEVVVTPTKLPIIGSGAKNNIALECKASGDQPLSVTWFKDGQPVTSDGHVFVLSGNVLLVNGPLTAADLGTYMCTANNPLGSAQASASAYDNRGSLPCQATFSSCTSAVCGATCPAGCAADTTPVYGVDIYHEDSSVCRAGIQAGVITDAGGLMVWSTKSTLLAYNAGNKNGVSSLTHVPDPNTTGYDPIE